MAAGTLSDADAADQPGGGALGTAAMTAVSFWRAERPAATKAGAGGGRAVAIAVASAAVRLRGGRVVSALRA